MQSAVVGFPRVGKQRELKFASEKYFRGELDEKELFKTAEELRKEHWEWQKANGIQYISSNDFSFYDGVLDTAVLLNVIPECYRNLGMSEIDTYFAMARGYQGKAGDVPALAMKKWFNTNYHYIVPEIEKETKIQLKGNKPFEEYREAKSLGIQTKPVLLGPFTFLKLAKYVENESAADYADSMAAAYREILEKFNELDAEWIQLDEPALVTDLSKEDIHLFETLYQQILLSKGKLKILLQTYFGDIRDCYENAAALDFDGIGLDFLEGKKTQDLIKTYGFPKDKVLFAGLINGKNIWKCNYKKNIDNTGQHKNKSGEYCVIDLVFSIACTVYAES